MKCEGTTSGEARKSACLPHAVRELSRDHNCCLCVWIIMIIYIIKMIEKLFAPQFADAEDKDSAAPAATQGRGE